MNSSNGVLIEVDFTGAGQNSIGGATTGAGNTIAFNGGDGVSVTDHPSNTGNLISSNSIFSNGELGINLEPSGPNFPQDGGDADTGANNQQNFPVLTSALTGPTSTTVEGSLNSTPNTTFTLQFFSSPQADASGFGEGKTLLGSVTVTTDASGDANFIADMLLALPAGELVITATATDPSGNTSEFSAAIAATPATLDFGDAPAPFATALADNGARHVIQTGMHLGADIDDEPDGQASAAADGDDTHGTDDEDGVVFTTALELGQTANVLVSASQPGLLAAWMDFNRDGDWADAGEQVFVNRSLASGTNLLNFTVPATAAPGGSFARFRFSSQSDLSFDGLAPDGEVEDFPVIIVDNREFDYGDAPAGYSTLLANDGARHAVSTSVRLGALIDSEDDGLPSLDADGTPLGDEFQVNTEAAGSQFSPSLGMNPSGDFVVTWYTPGRPGEGSQIFAQRFAADGTPQGAEFQVNSEANTGGGEAPEAAMADDGDFVIVWQRPGDDGSDDVYARRFAAAGTAQGDDFRVNTVIDGNQTGPSIAMRGSGDFVVAWLGSFGNVTLTDVFAQRFRADGTAVDPEFLVNTTMSGGQFSPSVAMNERGEFVLWTVFRALYRSAFPCRPGCPTTLWPRPSTFSVATGNFIDSTILAWTST